MSREGGREGERREQGGRGGGQAPNTDVFTLLARVWSARALSKQAWRGRGSRNDSRGWVERPTLLVPAASGGHPIDSAAEVQP